MPHSGRWQVSRHRWRDISVDFTQQLLSNANAQLYGGVGEIALISSNGRLAAYSTDKSLIGKPAAQILDAEEQVLVQRLPAGQSHYQIDRAGGHVALFLPFSFEGTDARWVLMLQLPIAEVMKDLDQLMAALGAESRSSLTTMLIIGVLIAVAGLLAIWLISRRITIAARHGGDAGQHRPGRR